LNIFHKVKDGQNNFHQVDSLHEYLSHQLLILLLHDVYDYYDVQQEPDIIFYVFSFIKIILSFRILILNDNSYKDFYNEGF
jgi:hypothetical protein